MLYIFTIILLLFTLILIYFFKNILEIPVEITLPITFIITLAISRLSDNPHLLKSSTITSLNGPREGCEDSVCQMCTNKDNYGQCKKKCIQDNADAIRTCCLQSCPSDSSVIGNECIDACNTALVYGPN